MPDTDTIAATLALVIGVGSIGLAVATTEWDYFADRKLSNWGMPLFAFGITVTPLAVVARLYQLDYSILSRYF